jgi:CO/xanthine dehydrogenase Mo-binding subunit
VYSNRVPAGAFRGFSTPQVIWAGESAIDELARELGLDPVEFRLRNLRDKGEPFFADDAPLDADLRGGLTTTVAKIPALARDLGPSEEKGSSDKQRTSEGHNGVRSPRLLYGAAAAVGVKDGGGGPAHTEAEVRLYPDGSIEVVAAAVELGQGVQSVLANVAAEVLGTEPGRIRVRLPDTADAPYDRGTGASRSTIGVGSAVQAAAQTLRRDIQRIAKARFDAGKTAVALQERCLLVGNRHVSYPEFIAADRGISPSDVGPMVARGVHNVRATGSSLGHSCPFYEVSHAAAAISVDPDTGFLGIEKVAIASDVGWAINREACLGQDEGAMMMGLGHTLFEELLFEDGQLVNGTLVEYRIPRTTDLPDRVDSFLIENQDGPGPYGSKGAGEGGILAIAAAIGNAFAVATGVRVRELPLTPERVWRALKAGSER